MATSLKPLDQQVIVITGASSGIGLCTAMSAAKKGAKLILASRSEQTLNDIGQKIRAEGGIAFSVACDVARREDCQRAADAAISQFGRIDTWVNNAGVAIYGRLDEVSEEDNR